MGTPNYAKDILLALIEANDIDVSLVITQPDRPVGRKRLLTPPPVKKLALEYDIRVLQPNRLTDEGITDFIYNSKPDFIIVAAFGQILPKEILDIAPCINLHASLLPQYRGASPVQQTLLNGDTKTGVTSMLMEEGLDTGAILDTVEFDVPNEMKLIELMEQLTNSASILTLETIRNYDKLNAKMQEHEKATLCKKIKKSDGEVNFNDAVLIYRKYKAFEGWPGIFLANGTKLYGIKLHDEDSIHEPYKILSIDKTGIMIGCKKGSLLISSLQPASKKAMSAKSYCAGRGLKIGDSII